MKIHIDGNSLKTERISSDTSKITAIIPIAVNKYISTIISFLGEEFEYQKDFNVKEIFRCLKELLNDSSERYDFNEISDALDSEELSCTQFQSLLSNLNEIKETQKNKGIYNTPNDITDFILSNSISMYLFDGGKLCSNFDDLIDFINEEQARDIIYEKSFFDPTCGSGEFLSQVINVKLKLLKKITESPKIVDYYRILSTMYGNDNDINAVDICKIRFFFEFAKRMQPEFYTPLIHILNKNFTLQDFINTDTEKNSKQYDIIIGNPPYVEDRSSAIVPNIKYGNIYANVIRNSMDILSNNGVMGFIIPISYISTPRMSPIRRYIESHSSEKNIFNFADRPSCLFRGVHQKLSILIVKKGIAQCKVRTSNYNHWYKEERGDLFRKIEITENKYLEKDFYPKLANEIEKSIYEKIHVNTSENLYRKMQSLSDHAIFLNMRATFWIKAFSFKQESNEFKMFKCQEHYKWLILAILNSSLFYFHWVTISDCWHITNRELATFRLPKEILNDDIKIKKLSELAKKLEEKLEATKVFINTKQTMYEYKHKLCKHVINEIDIVLADIYLLSSEERDYIKEYYTKYRESRGI